MKEMLINLLILLGLFNNINSMQEDNSKKKDTEEIRGLNLGDLELLPDEIRYDIIKSILKDNINKWVDIFKLDNKSLKDDLDRVRLISRGFNVFKKEINSEGEVICDELRDLVKRLKNERFEYLKENIKDRYKDLSKKELNEDLTNSLDNLYFVEELENRQVVKESLQNCIKFIIAGANINAVDRYEYGRTTLIWTAKSGLIKTVRLLIDTGADINIADDCGWTALDWAKKTGHKEIVELLKFKGAK